MGARNPKMARFSLNVTDAVNQRVEQLADAAQSNKGTVAALALVAGLNLLERVYMLNVEKYADQATEDKLAQMGQDLNSVLSGPSG
jgi:hypothetical protein